MAATAHHFRLASGPGSLGPSWNDAGRSLAGVALFRRTDDGFAPRPLDELEALLGATYERNLDASPVRGLGVAAAAEAARLGATACGDSNRPPLG